MSTSGNETGFVARVQDGVAFVKLSEQDGCGSCGARILCRPDGDGIRELKVDNRLGAKVGNRVEISEPGNLLLVLATLQYGLPFLGFIFGILFTGAVNISIANLPRELLLFCGGVAGLVLGGLVSWLWSKKIAAVRETAFEITKILG